jgi:hypothetical protein
LDQVLEVEDDHICQLKLLVLSALFQASLHDTAPMLVGSHRDTELVTDVKNELSMLNRCLLINLGFILFEKAQESLDHMVSMNI